MFRFLHLTLSARGCDKDLAERNRKFVVDFGLAFTEQNTFPSHEEVLDPSGIYLFCQSSCPPSASVLHVPRNILTLPFYES